MEKIFEYELELSGETSVQMPKDAEVLNVAWQCGKLKLFAIADTTKQSELIVFEVIESGDVVKPLDWHFRIYRGTVAEETTAYHVFEHFAHEGEC
ncbi:hypothetical protein [Rosistilla oblonga]|uniref:DUF7352 domain-containing protein n=1 Tax=Rosistilla oblonga TaxID=2527990 RepID=UPI003A96A705